MENNFDEFEPFDDDNDLEFVHPPTTDARPKGLPVVNMPDAAINLPAKVTKSNKANQTILLPSRIGALCFDLMLNTNPLASILDQYEITEDDLAAISETKPFLDAMEDVKKQIALHGAESGFILRSRALAEDLLPDMYAIAKNQQQDPAIRVKIYESLLKSGHLDPATQRKASESSGNTQSVKFYFGPSIAPLLGRDTLTVTTNTIEDIE